MGTGTAEKLGEELREAHRQGRIHGAYLFEGASGTGKRETALWFARLLLCRTRRAEPCGTCPDCRKTSGDDAGGKIRSRHPDLKVLEPEGPYLKVDQVRALQRELSLVANEGGWRVALILGAEALRIEAANALLKTLEEPPPRTTLILVASSASALPATVRSRTTQLRFAPEPEPSIRAALSREGLSEEDAWLAAALGGGSSAAARAWAEQHLETAREIRELLERLPSGSASEALDFAETFRGGSAAARTRAELLLAVHAALARREVENAAREARGAELERWLGFAESGERARREMARRNLNPQLLVEGLLLDLQEP
jgi:DNA polymerase-3 subunit delta'